MKKMILASALLTLNLSSAFAGSISLMVSPSDTKSSGALSDKNDGGCGGAAQTELDGGELKVSFKKVSRCSKYTTSVLNNENADSKTGDPRSDDIHFSRSDLNPIQDPEGRYGLISKVRVNLKSEDGQFSDSISIYVIIEE